MKGRIIGREGRNIRAFEGLASMWSSMTRRGDRAERFNPIRRETARLSMERLIQDGRIHPSRIEELVVQAKKDVHAKVQQMGKEAATEVDVRGLNNKIIGMLGALHYRTSYGQNVLRHSVEVAFLAQVMADELGWMVRWPSGRACCTTSANHDREVEAATRRSGLTTSASKEPQIVINAAEVHHAPPPTTCRWVIRGRYRRRVQLPAADAEHIKRLEKLEEIANSSWRRIGI
jgi:ribonuclease Y